MELMGINGVDENNVIPPKGGLGGPEHLIYLFLLEDAEYCLSAGREIGILALEEVADERFHLNGRKHFAHFDGVAAS